MEASALNLADGLPGRRKSVSVTPLPPNNEPSLGSVAASQSFPSLQPQLSTVASEVSVGLCQRFNQNKLAATTATSFSEYKKFLKQHCDEQKRTLNTVTRIAKEKEIEALQLTDRLRELESLTVVESPAKLVAEAASYAERMVNDKELGFISEARFMLDTDIAYAVSPNSFRDRPPREDLRNEASVSSVGSQLRDNCSKELINALTTVRSLSSRCQMAVCKYEDEEYISRTYQIICERQQRTLEHLYPRKGEILNHIKQAELRLEMLKENMKVSLREKKEADLMVAKSKQILERDRKQYIIRLRDMKDQNKKENQIFARVMAQERARERDSREREELLRMKIAKSKAMKAFPVVSKVSDKESEKLKGFFQKLQTITGEEDVMRIPEKYIEMHSQYVIMQDIKTDNMRKRDILDRQLEKLKIQLGEVKQMGDVPRRRAVDSMDTHLSQAVKRCKYFGGASRDCEKKIKVVCNTLQSLCNNFGSMKSPDSFRYSLNEESVMELFNYFESEISKYTGTQRAISHEEDLATKDNKIASFLHSTGEKGSHADADTGDLEHIISRNNLSSTNNDVSRVGSFPDHLPTLRRNTTQMFSRENREFSVAAPVTLPHIHKIQRATVFHRWGDLDSSRPGTSGTGMDYKEDYSKVRLMRYKIKAGDNASEVFEDKPDPMSSRRIRDNRKSSVRKSIVRDEEMM